MNLEAEINGQTIPVQLDAEAGTFTLPGKSGNYTWTPLSDGRFLLRVANKLYTVDGVQSNGDTVEFSLNGHYLTAKIQDEQALLLRSLGFKSASASSQGRLQAPMPGKILAVNVAEGDEVGHGQPVIILEAMKMENELKAPVGGRVVKIAAVAGSSVEKNQLLIEIEPIG